MSKSKKTKNAVEQKPVSIAAILYTDGSAKPNPGYGGWGIHGYTIDINNPVNISASQAKNIVTRYGYKTKADVNLEKLDAYRKIDTITAYGTGPENKVYNNNEMELYALRKGLELGIKNQYKSMTILTDSQMALNSIGHWYDKWEQNGWMKNRHA